ncbi:MAG: SRPBCC domain-containing protein [Methanothrix sp.]|jgi:carbon monoxide dehydrogenase subunit G
MQTEFSGTIDLDAAPDKVKELISNTELVASCIPDSKDFKKLDATHFSITVNVGISMVRGPFKLSGITESMADYVQYSISGKGLGSEVDITIKLSVAGTGPSASRVTWSATAEFKGIISGVSEPIIRKITDEKVEEIASNLKAKLGNRVV